MSVLVGGWRPMARVGFYDDPVFGEHDAGPGHPERPERLEAVRRGLREGGLEKELVRLAPRAATREELLRVHTAAHVDRLAAAAGRQRALRPGHRDGPALSRGGPRGGRGRRGRGRARPRRLARPGLLRRAPPGPPRDTAAGPWASACSTTWRSARPRPSPAACKRVAVIDFDVHHGNGTQEAFWRDPRVLFVSSHQFPYYPGTGALDEVGEGEGRGFTVNLPDAGRPGRRRVPARLPRDRGADRPGIRPRARSRLGRASTPTGTTRSGAWR